jgi:putative thiamine transport system permease protein
MAPALRKVRSFAAGGWLRLLPGLTLALFLLPVLAGLAGTLLPAFGILPGSDATGFSLKPWARLLSAPELPGALLTSLVSGFLATLLSFATAVAIAAALHGTRFHGWLARLLSPLLALPHAAIAIGFAFLIAPSGWLVRVAAPLLAPSGQPPDFAAPGDSLGLALAAGLTLKETPFLLLAILSGLGQFPADRALLSARMLGYRPATAWLKVVLPQLYPQLRLPIYAVLAFSLSVVDMGLILGPSAPPALAPLLLAWFNDASLVSLFPAAAGAVLQALLAGAAIFLWRSGEIAVIKLSRSWLAGGGRGGHGIAARIIGFAAACGLLLVAALAIVALALWSFAWRWPFPAVLPVAWTLGNWAAPSLGLGRTLGTSLLLGLGATGIALALSLGCLENERRGGLHPTARVLWLIYLPLLVPQISFLSGTATLDAWLGIDATLLALIWSHLLFVLPYVFLMLADPYRSLDERYARTGLCLGAGRGRVFFSLTLPLLLRPILGAAAVGFSVSLSLYLPTLFAGAGRFETLATEAVALATGGDRRLAGVFGFLQACLPLLGFAAALLLPALVYRNRRGLKVGG